jgi:hypothetical protein
MAGKSETKMKTAKVRTRNLLSDVAEEKVFWSHDGQIFKNLYELDRGLNNMSDEAYRYHANAEKNDFSVWVREVIGDDSLAKSLDKASNRMDAAMKVEGRIHHFNPI